MTDSQNIVDVWGEILSRRPTRIKRSFESLDAFSQQEVLQHLNHMITDDGWQEVQVTSAAYALKTINSSISINHE